MNKTYNQRENAMLYFGLAFVAIGVFVFGIWLIDKYLWILLAPVLFLFGKAINISKNKIDPIITLTDDKITFIKMKKSYNYNELSKFHLDSKWFNGHIILKENNKKINFHSVAISKEDQREIRGFVNNKIRENK